jgi:hypothetical protein
MIEEYLLAAGLMVGYVALVWIMFKPFRDRNRKDWFK